jgi:hypothetical protein
MTATLRNGTYVGPSGMSRRVMKMIKTD